MNDFVWFLASVGTWSMAPFSFFLAFLTFKGLRLSRRAEHGIPGTSSYPKLLVLIPAHNEEVSISFTIQSVLAVDYPKDSFQVLVLADNCSDRTTAIAEAEGALVYVRKDTLRRGKGFALEDSFAKVLKDPKFSEMEGFIVLDADSAVGSDLLKQFADALQKGADFAQCYSSVGNRDASIRTQLLTYALSLFNGVYMQGLDQAGLGAHLRGNGMGFSRTGYIRRPWSASSLAEDLEFSWRLRLQGEKVWFLSESTIFAEMPSQSGPSVSQRARWEHGRAYLKKEYTKALLHADVSLLKRLCWLMDLWMPSLSNLCGVVFLSFFVLIGMYVTQGSFGVVSVVAALSFLSILFYLGSPFFIMKLPMKYLASLWFAPYYAVWRLGVLLKKKPQEWIRTARERSGESK
ncbi:MAG: glycosyltransferase family 2 protein [Pseudomonadota bacterium]